jgi:hypothetical protein
MPPNIQNLKPWPKGVSGNAGRSAKKPLQIALEAELDAKPELLRAMVQKGLKMALEGDFRYWAAIWDRLDGKVPLPISVEPVNTDDYGILVELPKPEVADGKENITSGD